MIVTLDEVKKHLNVEFNDDDNYINDLINVAICSVSDYCNWSYYTYPVPPPVKHAILLLVGNFYANREPVSFGQAYKVPLTYEYLLAPYIKY